jgi:hypothetical protein
MVSDFFCCRSHNIFILTDATCIFVGIGVDLKKEFICTSMDKAGKYSDI